MRSSDNWSDQLSDDRITRETLSNNNPCPSSPSSTIYIYIYFRNVCIIIMVYFKSWLNYVCINLKI